MTSVGKCCPRYIRLMATAAVMRATTVKAVRRMARDRIQPNPIARITSDPYTDTADAT